MNDSEFLFQLAHLNGMDWHQEDRDRVTDIAGRYRELEHKLSDRTAMLLYFIDLGQRPTGLTFDTINRARALLGTHELTTTVVREELLRPPGKREA